jgi:hypothetical protein
MVSKEPMPVQGAPASPASQTKTKILKPMARCQRWQIFAANLGSRPYGIAKLGQLPATVEKKNQHHQQILSVNFIIKFPSPLHVPSDHEAWTNSTIHQIDNHCLCARKYRLN